MTTTVLTTTIHLHAQLVQDTLTGRDAVELVRDWVSDYFSATVSVRSWTPYWKEIQMRHSEEKMALIRFRLGGPVVVKQLENWEITQAELSRFEKALLALLDELGRAMTQQRVADAIQSRYPRALRQVRDDDTILLQFSARTTTDLDIIKHPPVDVAVIVRPDQTLHVYARCQEQKAGHSTVRRLLANLQVAGIPLDKTETVTKHR